MSDAFLCGPGEPSETDRESVEGFAKFLRGELGLCAECQGFTKIGHRCKHCGSSRIVETRAAPPHPPEWSPPKWVLFCRECQQSDHEHCKDERKCPCAKGAHVWSSTQH